MSTNAACFLFGIVATAFWLFAVWKGIMPGGRATFFGLVGRTGFVYRSAHPFRFWFTTAFLGVFALGLLVFPVLSWLGLRN
jgi:hypothetical protein